MNLIVSDLEAELDGGVFLSDEHAVASCHEPRLRLAEQTRMHREHPRVRRDVHEPGAVTVLARVALRLPVATLRNWEQGRSGIDPAARSLLIVVARNPKLALAALAAEAA